jgi:hypothetical protein
LKVLQVIRNWDELYLFTETPEISIKVLVDEYENGDGYLSLWCDTPEITEYEFLGKKYLCIWLWYDYEDDVAEEAKKYFDNLK